MFVAVSRVTLEIPASGSLKAKRQVVRRITDRVKARFNVAVAEVEDNDVWQRAVLALAVVANDRRFANEQMDKILQFIEDMYVAPVLKRELELLSFGEQLFSGQPEDPLDALLIPRGERSLAEAEGLGAWEDRRKEPVVDKARPAGEGLDDLEQARERARRLRNPRDWEK